MSKTVKIITLIIILSAGMFFSASLHAEEPVIDIKTSGYQGDAVFATIADPDSNIIGAAFWNNLEYKLFNKGPVLQAILSIPVEAAPGESSIKFLLTKDKGMDGYSSFEIIKTVNIKAKKFPAQYLTLSKTQKQNYHSKTKDDEDDILDARIMTYSNERLWKGNFTSPCRGPVVTQLGTRRYHNGEYYNFHKGIDIAAPQGAPVCAAGSGKVVFAKYIPVVYGNTIVVDHGQGVTSLYIHLSKMEVKENQDVKKNQLIGRVGATGTSSGPHLHWGLFVNGEAVNPQCFYNMPEEFK
ncbi:MAG: M23 family metallopeptidase [Armatimonadota bacterium]